MNKIIFDILEFKWIFLSILIIVLTGLGSGFELASVAFFICLLLFKGINKIEFLFITLFTVFFLADNYQNFSFMDNLRFVVLPSSIVVLWKYNLFYKNFGNFFIPFTIIAVSVSFFSNLGVQSILRSLAFLIVPLVIFKFVSLLYSYNSKRTSEIIITFLFIYFSINLLFFFSPFINVYTVGRFRGLTGNPNGLGMICFFCYCILTLISRRNLTTYTPQFFSIFKIILFTLIIVTASRTSLIALLAFESLVRFRNFNKFLLSTTFLFLLVISTTINFSGLIDNLGLSSFFRVETIVDFSGRLEVWNVALEDIKSSPLFGNGMTYDDLFIKDYAQYYVDQKARHWSGIWNSYLSLLLNVGVVGLVAYFYFWIKVYNKPSFSNLSFPFVFGCLLIGITESWMNASMNAMTPLMLLFWAIQTCHIKKTNY